MKNKVTTFLMFDGEAGGAIEFYLSVFEDAQLLSLSVYGEESNELQGLVEQALLALGGQEFLIIDSPVQHDFKMTPAISLFVECKSKKEIETYYDLLKDDGKTLMKLGNYGFGELYAWIEDQFGVSWQLILS